MIEIAPRKVRGTIVSGYQFCITLGLLLASCVVYGTEGMMNSRSYRISIGIQWVWALILCEHLISGSKFVLKLMLIVVGLFFLPESPRYFVKRGRLDKAQESLARVRGRGRYAAAHRGIADAVHGPHRARL